MYRYRKNGREAEIWYEKAALQGEAEAQNALGLCLCNSEDKKKHKVGLNWLEKAAVQEFYEAKYNLAAYRQKGWSTCMISLHVLMNAHLIA